VILDPRDHRRLVDEMLSFEGAEVRTHRDRYVWQLGDLLGGELVFRRSDVSFDDLWRLIGVCAATPGALALLPEAIASVDGETWLVQRFRALVAIHQPPPILTDDERREIVEAAATLDERLFAELSQLAVGRLGQRVRPPADDLDAVLRELEEAVSDPDARPPLMGFFDDILALISGSTRRDIRQLAESVSRRMGVRTPAITGHAAPPRGKYPDQLRRAYFVVLIDTDAIDNSRYLFKAWLVTWQHRRNGETGWNWEPVARPQERFRWEQIEAEIDEVLARLARRNATIGDLMVEFIVSRPLLDREYDRWLVAAPGVRNALGVHYPVVVRDLPRMRNSLIRSPWHARCRGLREQGQHVRANAVAYERLTHPYEAEHLHARLLRDATYPMCLVLFVSAEEAAKHVQVAVGAAVTAGLPVVVWCRDRAAASRFDSFMPEVLMARSVSNLPELVWELRRDAASEGGSPEHLGLHLTLLWDISDRVPPDYALSEPV
jgi:hypothetical protein